MPNTLTELLRRRLGEVGSLTRTSEATGVNMASLSKFFRAKQTLQLNSVDRLLGYLNIECRAVRRKA